MGTNKLSPRQKKLDELLADLEDYKTTKVRYENYKQESSRHNELNDGDLFKRRNFFRTEIKKFISELNSKSKYFNEWLGKPVIGEYKDIVPQSNLELIICLVLRCIFNESREEQKENIIILSNDLNEGEKMFNRFAYDLNFIAKQFRLSCEFDYKHFNASVIYFTKT